MAELLGARRERMQFVRKTRVQRSDGGFDLTESALFTVWASVRPVQGREFEQAGRLAGAVTYLIEVDAKSASGLLASDAAVWTTRGSLRLNLREIRTSPLNNLILQIVAETGVVS